MLNQVNSKMIELLTETYGEILTLDYLTESKDNFTIEVEKGKYLVVPIMSEDNRIKFLTVKLNNGIKPVQDEILAMFISKEGTYFKYKDGRSVAQRVSYTDVENILAYSQQKLVEVI